MRKMLVCGATSAIVAAACRYFAAEQTAFVLAGRNEAKLDMLAADLKARGASSVEKYVIDFLDWEKHEALLQYADRALSGFDTILIGHGTLGDQKKCEADFTEAFRELNANGLSAMSLAASAANMLEARGNGTIAVITSVAGDRGRQSNYVYGTAKGALHIFLQGLRNRLAKKGVAVVTIKPGFVDTPMTAAIKKGPLFASADAVGKGVYQAIVKKKNEVYLPIFWQGIMFIVKAIPEGVFKKLRL